MATINGTTLGDTLPGTLMDDTINGRGGDDSISGLGGDDSLSGGDGRDSLDGGEGDDTMSGGANKDVLLTSMGRDVVDGGSNADTLVVDYSGLDVDIINNGEMQFGEATGTGATSVTFDSVETFNVTTGSGDDSIRTFVRDSFDNNVIVSGDDLIVLGDGADQAAGGDGADRLYGDGGNDLLDGDGTLRGKSGGDGGNLRDFVFIGDDQLFGGVGMDSLYGSGGSDILVGGIGDDQLFGDKYAFRAVDGSAAGGPSVQVISQDFDFSVGTSADLLNGGGGDDLLDGGYGTDTVFGGSGDDTAVYDASYDGADVTDLGRGDDVVQVSASLATAPSQIRLTFTSAEVGNDVANDGGAMANQDGGLAVRLQGEDSAGAPSGDVARFDDEGITFVAEAGITFDVRDLVSGAARGDLFEVVTLGTGAGDALATDHPNRSYYINGGGGADTITGGAVRDFLVGGSGDDVLDGGVGNDSFIGGGGNDTIAGGFGIDTAIYGGTTTGVDVDLGTVGPQNTLGAGIDSLSSIENLTGSQLDDKLTGDNGDNVIDGAAGDDRLFGSGGADTLIGGLGADTMRGGAGDDRFTFVVLEDGVAARIADLEMTDTIDLSGIDADTTMGGDQGFTFTDAFSATAGEAVLTFDAQQNNTFVLLDVDGDGVADSKIVLIGGDYTDFNNFAA